MKTKAPPPQFRSGRTGLLLPAAQEGGCVRALRGDGHRHIEVGPTSDRVCGSADWDTEATRISALTDSPAWATGMNIRSLPRTQAVLRITDNIERYVKATSPRPHHVSLSRDVWQKLRDIAKTDDLDFDGIPLVRRSLT